MDGRDAGGMILLGKYLSNLPHKRLFYCSAKSLAEEILLFPDRRLSFIKQAQNYPL